jgi:hypothetical protein
VLRVLGFHLKISIKIRSTGYATSWLTGGYSPFARWDIGIIPFADFHFSGDGIGVGFISGSFSFF